MAIPNCFSNTTLANGTALIKKEVCFKPQIVPLVRHVLFAGSYQTCRWHMLHSLCCTLVTFSAAGLLAVRCSGSAAGTQAYEPPFPCSAPPTAL